MSKITSHWGRPCFASLLLIACASVSTAAELGCSEAARLLRYACEFDSQGDFLEETAPCLDEETTDQECLAEVEEAFEEDADECDDMFEARLEVCDALDDAVHEPAFGEAFAANFVDPADIGNGVTPHPYWPLVPGNRWTYEGTFIDEDDGEEVTETITVTVTNKTKLIEGITCVVVTDIEEEDGEVLEQTADWYAQDVDGNVWYCGEISQEFEYFEGDEPEEGELVEIEGSWKAGVETAEAGILIPADLQIGDVIRQELLISDAEDVVEIVSLTATESAPGGSCSGDCLQTRDFTPIEPDADEHKFYALGIGLIVEIDLETGDRVELIQFVGAGS